MTELSLRSGYAMYTELLLDSVATAMHCGVRAYISYIYFLGGFACLKQLVRISFVVSFPLKIFMGKCNNRQFTRTTPAAAAAAVAAHRPKERHQNGPKGKSFFDVTLRSSFYYLSAAAAVDVCVKSRHFSNESAGARENLKWWIFVCKIVQK